MHKRDSDGIDPELLAALLDGRVAEPQRTELLARLGPDELALLADVAAVQRDAETSVVPIAAGPRRRWRARNLGFLAIAAGVIGVTTFTLARREAARERGLPPDLAFTFPSWQDATRGNVGPLIDTVALSWRVGTRMADVDAAIAARDSGGLTMVAGDLATLLASADAGLSAPLYQRIADSAGAPAGRLRELARDARDGLTRRVDRRIVSLAEWMESMRIAAHGDIAAGRSASDTDRRLTELAAVNPGAAAAIRNAIGSADREALKRALRATLDSLGR